MPCIIKNNSNIDLKPFEDHVHSMYDFFDSKLGFKKPPTLFFRSDNENKDAVLGKTGYYDGGNHEIHVYTDGRHPKDMLRSIAHELIHHHQNLDGRLNVDGFSGDGYYLHNKNLKKLEHEAMLKGNAYMREWEDLQKEESNKMSLKEWKNNELNKLMLKKFGILKEGGAAARLGNEIHDEGHDRMLDDRIHEKCGDKEEETLYEGEEESSEEELEEGGRALRGENEESLKGQKPKEELVAKGVRGLSETKKHFSKFKKIFNKK